MANTETTPVEQNATLTPDQAKAVLQFLQRTQLQGSEMPAYVSVFNSLSAIAATGESAEA